MPKSKPKAGRKAKWKACDLYCAGGTTQSVGLQGRM